MLSIVLNKACCLDGEPPPPPPPTPPTNPHAPVYCTIFDNLLIHFTTTQADTEIKALLRTSHAGERKTFSLDLMFICIITSGNCGGNVFIGERPNNSFCRVGRWDESKEHVQAVFTGTRTVWQHRSSYGDYALLCFAGPVSEGRRL